LTEATRRLASSLSAYSDAAYRAAKSEPDEGIIAARQKVRAARELILSSRLAYALGRCIPGHIQHWGSASKRNDFLQSVCFDGVNIWVEDTEDRSTCRTKKILKVHFTFNSCQYAIVLQDDGLSPVPETCEYTGTIDLWSNDQHVAKFDIRENISKEYSHWEFSDVQVLRVGPWMKDILDIAAQIEARQNNSMQNRFDEGLLKAARNIDLG
jgi:hypothetical protein